jgi:hypothetical protein
MPIFHSLAMTKVLNGNGDDFYVYLSQKGLGTVVIGKCKIDSRKKLYCEENNFGYTQGLSVRRLDMN